MPSLMFNKEASMNRKLAENNIGTNNIYIEISQTRYFSVNKNKRAILLTWETFPSNKQAWTKLWLCHHIGKELQQEAHGPHSSPEKIVQ